MKRLDISELLRAVLSPKRFQDIYADELSSHLGLLRKKGSSAPVILAGEEYVFVDREGFRRLLQFFETGQISKEMLCYILDALTLDEKTRFVDQGDREIAMDLSDEGFDHADIKAILADWSRIEQNKRGGGN
jgi:hypothetical protein